MMSSIWAILSQECLQKIIEQANLVFLSLLAALAIGIPLGIAAARFKYTKNFILSMTSILWTIPSLALLAFLIPFTGIGMKPALIALSLYALLPITRATYTGICSISEDDIEAAKGLGLTPFQRLRLIEVPLALPIIMAGIRNATVMCVGIATLAAFIGAGGLGDFINRGLAMNNTQLILLGAIPATIMALLLDFALHQFEIALNRRQRKQNKVFFFTAILIMAFLPYSTFKQISVTESAKTIHIASKNFTEQFILGEIIAQLIEKNSNLKVVRQFNLGTSAIVHKAMLADEVDLYPEYSGTAYLTLLHLPYNQANTKTVYQKVKDEYTKRFAFTWLKPFGFANNQVLAIRSDVAERYHIKTISDLSRYSKQFTIGAPAEFTIRPDGLPGLKKAYALAFKKVIAMDPGLMYRAIKDNRVDVIAGFSTDPRISLYRLNILKDNKHFFPPYAAAIVIRKQTLQRFPQLTKILDLLANKINAKTMLQLNYAVEVEHKSPEAIARNFLSEHIKTAK